ncbi:polymorphic toxin-type HINT domain-containing protein [Saccharomonospora xinjiangensis]|uniref:polymorphic toxin-type HINT domain-containing protein n=1 Tax=Saccharomonospora xinjiangensis TaxID=75294 RepID=UPI0009FE48CE|nr:polymorphic toxin-type HINT domain-containing protein [Saccharomonospora xinjiangensis]
MAAARVRRDVLTPHKRPEPTRTLSPEIRKRLDAVQNSAPIDVGVVLPESSADDFAEAITTHVPISAPRGGPSPGVGRADVEWSASCPTSNSFVPGTKVVMADGSAKPIEEVELGDRVLATDPETGQTVPRKVTATITGEGQKRLVEVTIDIDGEAGEQTETITATDGHPFWVADLEEWVPAGELQPGDWLRTGSGSWVQIQSTNTRTEAQRVHNLTIDDLHTYHVVAVETPVLVHNCGGTIEPSLVRFSQDSVSPRFSSGETIEQTPAALRSGYLKANDLPTVRLTVKGGQVHALDNRRLVAFQKAGTPMPFRMATSDEVANEAWKFTTRNEGRSIMINYFDPLEWTP